MTDLRKHLLNETLKLSRAPRKPRKSVELPDAAFETPEIKNGQAARIICRFGGVGNLAAGLGLTNSAIYRWLKPRPMGTGGVIPGKQMQAVLQAARLAGILLSDEDLSPRVVDDERMKTEYLADFNRCKMMELRIKGVVK